MDNKKTPSHSGFLSIDNPNLPFPMYWPTSDGDEGMGVGELAAMPIVGFGNVGFHAGQALRDYQDKGKGAGPVMSMGGKKYQLQKSAKPRRPKARPDPNAPLMGRGLTPGLGWW